MGAQAARERPPILTLDGRAIVVRPVLPKPASAGGWQAVFERRLITQRPMAGGSPAPQAYGELHRPQGSDWSSILEAGRKPDTARTRRADDREQVTTASERTHA